MNRKMYKGMPPSIMENEGMGQNAPVYRPAPQGAQDQSQPMLPPAPPIDPLPSLTGMDPMSQATPGGGGENTDALLQLLLSMGQQKGSGY